MTGSRTRCITSLLAITADTPFPFRPLSKGTPGALWLCLLNRPCCNRLLQDSSAFCGYIALHEGGESNPLGTGQVPIGTGAAPGAGVHDLNVALAAIGGMILLLDLLSDPGRSL